jgi:hypothetical protein
LLINLLGWFVSPYVAIAYPLLSLPIVYRAYLVNREFQLLEFGYFVRLMFFELVAEALTLVTFLYYAIALSGISQAPADDETVYTSAFPQDFIVIFWFGFCLAYIVSLLLFGVPGLSDSQQLRKSESQQSLTAPSAAASREDSEEP